MFSWMHSWNIQFVELKAYLEWFNQMNALHWMVLIPTRSFGIVHYLLRFKSCNFANESWISLVAGGLAFSYWNSFCILFTIKCINFSTSFNTIQSWTIVNTKEHLLEIISYIKCMLQKLSMKSLWQRICFHNLIRILLLVVVRDCDGISKLP